MVYPPKKTLAKGQLPKGCAQRAQALAANGAEELKLSHGNGHRPETLETLESLLKNMANFGEDEKRLLGYVSMVKSSRVTFCTQRQRL